MNNKIPCGGFYLSDTLGVDENGQLGVNGGEPYKSLVTDGDGNVKWEDRLAYDNKESASFAICTSGYASFPDGRGYYDVPDEMWKLLLNENATIIDEASGAVMMDRRVNESNGEVSYSTGDSIGVIGLRVSTIYKQAYLFDTGLSDGVIGGRHTITASIDDFKQIDQKFIPPLILESSTPGSNKKFRISVDDSGTITATEV